VQPFDPIATLLRRWRVILAFTVLGAIAGLAYGLLAPKWYSSTLTVVPSQRSQDAASSIAAKLPAIGGLDSGVVTDVQRIRAVLTSNSVADAVIAKFNLKEHYDADHLEEARKNLWEHCGVSADRKSGVVSLSCEDKDPKTAQAMAAYFGEVGNSVFGRISSSSAREERRFLEEQVKNSRQAVDEASRKLREFQESYKIVDLPEQSKAVISAMASIKGELISKQLELSYLRSFSSSAESNVVQLQQQIAVMEQKLAQLEKAKGFEPASGSASGSGAASAQPKNDKGTFFPGAMNVPELRFELESLLREQKIQETVFFLTMQRYEMAKVDEARDTSTFQILDVPTVPTYKSRPRRSRVLMLGVLGGLVAGAAFLLVPAFVRRRRSAPDPV
jgi:tyrosine-protein kinase Etk/Wzc